MDSWEPMEGIDKLKQFIRDEMARLEHGSYNPRVRRQLADGDRFLKMLYTMPFCEARRVGQLRTIISKKRTELKENVQDMSKLLPNYQLSIFDEVEVISEEQMKKVEIHKKEMEEEIHWLHKALGICRNKNYFK